jgi:hypothetical protein
VGVVGRTWNGRDILVVVVVVVVVVVITSSKDVVSDT